jgi:glycosyltransferase involved in cell wall biosynthesis
MSRRRSGWPRVLILRSDASAGADARTWEECHTLLAAGYEVLVIGPPTAACPPGVQHYVRARRSGLLADTRSCLGTALLCVKVLYQRGFDFVQWNNPPDLLWAVAAPYRLLGKKLVHDHRDAWPEQARGRVRRLWRQVMQQASFRVAHRVVVATLDDDLPASRAQRVAVPVATGATPLVEMGADDALLRGHAVLCCCVDAVPGRQGPDLLLHAWDVLVHTMMRTDVRLAVLTDPPNAQRLANLVTQLRLEQHVELVPSVDVLTRSRYLASAHLAACADTERHLPDALLSNAVESAMLAGLPHVAVDRPELRNVLQSSGLYARPGDVVALARGVLTLADKAHQRRLMGAEARQRARTLLQWRVGAPGYVRCFDDLLGLRTGPVVVLVRPVDWPAGPRYVVQLDARTEQRRHSDRRRGGLDAVSYDRRADGERRGGDRRALATSGASGGH